MPRIIHPVTYVGPGFVLTDKEAWAWIRLPEENTFLQAREQKELVPNRMNSLLQAILDDKDEEVDIHVRTVNRILDVQGWYDDLKARVAQNSPPPAFADMSGLAAQHLDSASYRINETYLGVRLGYRTDALESPAKDALSTVRRWVTRPAAGADLAVSPAEEAHWAAAARAVHARARHVINGVSLASAPALIWLMRKPFYLTYGCPEIDIPRDESFPEDAIAEFATGELEVTPRYIAVTNPNPLTGQPETFYTTMVCISEFSRHMFWPEAAGWADVVRSADLDAECEWSIRASILPPAVVRKQIKKNLDSIQGELIDSADSGHDGGRRLQEQAAETRELEYQAANSRPAWLKITYRLQLRAMSPERLEDSVNNLKTQLRAANLTLLRPPHDQLDLLMESVPGGQWRERLYPRRQDLAVLGGGGLLSSYRVGDEDVLGPYLGRVIVGDRPPVFFDTNRAPATNKPPVTAVTGSPGRGKMAWIHEPVPTPSGWTTMGELEPGDQVFDENGNVCNVTYVTPIRLSEKSYRVTFSDGSTVYVCGDHRWLTDTSASRKSAKRQDVREAIAAGGGVVEALARAIADADPEDVMTVGDIASHWGLERRFLRRHARSFPSCGVTNEGQALYAVRDLLAHVLGGVRVGLTDDDLGRVRDALAAAPEGQLVSVSDVSEMTGLSTDYLNNHARVLPVEGRRLGARGGECRMYDARMFFSRILEVGERGGRQSEKLAVPQVRTTEEIRATLTVGADNRANHSIRVAGPLDLPEANLPIDPYVLGVWLGDGNSRQGNFCGIDHEIAMHVEAAGYQVISSRPTGHELRHPDYRVWRVEGLTSTLRTLGLLQNTTAEGSRKRIPEAYLRASIAQRRALLAGLLDTDGTVSPDGSTEFANTNEVLARQVHELALSLGYRATVASGTKRSQSGAECIAYVVSWTAPESDFRLERKTLAHKERSRNYSAARNDCRYIVAIDPVDPLPMRCITVDSPSHLYLIGESMIPTHNTFLSLMLAYQCASMGYRTIYIDPKRDASNLALLPGIGKTNLIDLAEGNEGLLDPFRLSSGVEASGLLAMEVLKTLVGNLTEERESVLAAAIDQVKSSANPSLWALTELLASHPSGSPQYNVGSLLKSMRQAPFGRLLFSQNPAAGRISASDGLTVITLLGLDTPPSNLPVEDYTYDQRIGVAVMYLLTKYCYALMESGDKNAPKALFIDEAWSVLATRSGRDLVNRWGRMGRSHNAALVLVTQSVRDFETSGIANQVSTRLAFGTTDPTEYESILKFMGVDPDANSLKIVEELSGPQFIGHCLMKDPNDRIGVIQVDPYRSDLRAAFDTNPLTRGRQAEG